MRTLVGFPQCLLCLLLLSPMVLVRARTSFAYVGMQCKRNRWSMKGETVICNHQDSLTCSAGDEVTMVGDLKIHTSLPQEYQTIIKECKYHFGPFSFACPYDQKFDDLDLCERGNLKPQTDDIYCGKAGSYSLFIQEELPGFRLVLGFGYAMYLEGSIIDTTDPNNPFEYEHCTMEFHAVRPSFLSSSTYSKLFGSANSAYSYDGVAAAVGVSALILIYYRTCRRGQQQRTAAVEEEAVPTFPEDGSSYKMNHTLPIHPQNVHNTNNNHNSSSLSSCSFVEMTDRQSHVVHTARAATSFMGSSSVV